MEKKYIEKCCEFCNNIMEIPIVTIKNHKNYGKIVKNKDRRFCSLKCQINWQKSISWEERIGKERADEMRQEVSERVSGNNNPSCNSEVAKKISESLSKYLTENPNVRVGENNPAFGIKRDDLIELNKSRIGSKTSKEVKDKISDGVKKAYSEGRIKPNIRAVSKPEKELYKYITEILKLECKRQYHILNYTYIYDLYIPKYNLIIEYNGSLWHCNPNKYKSGEYIKFPGKIVLVDDIWERDKNKINNAKNSAYNIEIIWDFDYKNSGFNIIKKIIEKYEKFSDRD